MGLYDEFRCEAPLPDKFDAGGVVFQTKSFPDCYGAEYTLTTDGRVLDALGIDMEIDGYIEFYTSEGDWRAYRASFRDGKLKAIESVTESQKTGWYLGIARCRISQAPSVLFESPGND